MRKPIPRIGGLALAMMLAESASVIRRHWTRLDPGDQREFRRLVTKARGRPSNLTAVERDELSRLIRQLDLGLLGRDMIRVLSPIRFGRRP